MSAYFGAQEKKEAIALSAALSARHAHALCIGYSLALTRLRSLSFSATRTRTRTTSHNFVYFHYLPPLQWMFEKVRAGTDRRKQRGCEAPAPTLVSTLVSTRRHVSHCLLPSLANCAHPAVRKARGPSQAAATNQTGTRFHLPVSPSWTVCGWAASLDTLAAHQRRWQGETGRAHRCRQTRKQQFPSTAATSL